MRRGCPCPLPGFVSLALCPLATSPSLLLQIDPGSFGDAVLAWGSKFHPGASPGNRLYLDRNSKHPEKEEQTDKIGGGGTAQEGARIARLEGAAEQLGDLADGLYLRLYLALALQPPVKTKTCMIWAVFLLGMSVSEFFSISFEGERLQICYPRTPVRKQQNHTHTHTPLKRCIMLQSHASCGAYFRVNTAMHEP